MPGELGMHTSSVVRKLATQSGVIPNQSLKVAISTRDNGGITAESDVATAQPFELMKLPVEIRHMIFKEFLVMPNPIMFYGFGIPPCAIIKSAKEGPQTDGWPTIEDAEIIRQSSRLNIFLVSKAIYCETIPLYFGHNIFSFESGHSLWRFASTIGPDSRWQLARVQCHWVHYCVRAAKILTQCVGLRELSLELSFHSFGRVDDSNSGYRLLGMEDLLRVRGLNKLSLHTDGRCYCGSCPGQGCINMARVECPFLTQIKYVLEVLKQPLDAREAKERGGKGYLLRG